MRRHQLVMEEHEHRRRSAAVAAALDHLVDDRVDLAGVVAVDPGVGGDAPGTVEVDDLDGGPRTGRPASAMARLERGALYVAAVVVAADRHHRQPARCSYRHDDRGTRRTVVVGEVALGHEQLGRPRR